MFDNYIQDTSTEQHKNYIPDNIPMTLLKGK